MFQEYVKWHGRLQLESGQMELKQKGEFLKQVRSHTLRAVYLSTFNISTLKSSFYRSMVSVTRGNYEVSMTSGRDGETFPKLDFINIGLARLDPLANIAAEVALDPSAFGRPTEISVGLSKEIGPGLSVKARYDLVSRIVSYNSKYRPSSSQNLDFGLSFRVAMREEQGLYRGFGEYPFNFGIEVNYLD